MPKLPWGGPKLMRRADVVKWLRRESRTLEKSAKDEKGSPIHMRERFAVRSQTYEDVANLIEHGSFFPK